MALLLSVHGLGIISLVSRPSHVFQRFTQNIENLAWEDLDYYTHGDILLMCMEVACMHTLVVCLYLKGRR